MGARVGVVAFLVLVVVVQPVGAVSLSDSAFSADDPIRVAGPDTGRIDGSGTTLQSGPSSRVSETEGDIVRTMTFSLTPNEPGSVEVQVEYDLPDTVVELDTSFPEDATIESTRGFHDSGDGNYSWNGATERPSITFAFPANRTGSYRYQPDSQLYRTDTPNARPDTEGYLFADAGEWAIVSVPPLSTWWTYRGSPSPELHRRVQTAGEGVAGTRMVYLGPHRAETRMVGDQQVTVVVPDAATLEPSRDALFDSLDAAANSLRVGNPPSRTLLIAAPTSVEWGPNGLTDRPDSWVRADQSLESPYNVWLHEYLHVRQDFTTTADARWTVEAMGEYYAAALSLEQGLIGFDTYRRHLDRGADSRFHDSVLSRPETWGHMANYAKGGLVFGNLDRQMRLSTDGSNPATDLFRAMNERKGPVSHEFVRRRVADLAGEETAQDFDRQVTDTGTPTMWTREEHTAAFSTLPPRIETNVAGSHSVTGPYRNRSVQTIPTLVTGETLEIPVTVTNEGDATGEYQITLRRNGSAVEELNGSLDGGTSTNQSFHFDAVEAGRYQLEIGDWTRTIGVREPARPTVTDLTVPDTPVDVGDSFEIRVSVANTADRPADGAIEVRVDGTSVTSKPTRLDVGETGSVTFELSSLEPGEHEIRSGDHRRTVTVGEQKTSTGPQETSQGTEPGGTTSGAGTVETRTDATDEESMTTEPTGTTVPGMRAEPLVAFAIIAVVIAMRRRNR